MSRAEAPKPASIHITDHAKRRYLERIDSEEPYPGTAIRGAWKATRDGTPGDTPPIVLVCAHGPRGAAVLTVYAARGEDSHITVT